MPKLMPEHLDRMIRRSDTLRPVLTELYTLKHRLKAAIHGAPDWLAWRVRKKAQAARLPRDGSLHVALVSYHPALVREAKLAHALRLCNHRVTLVLLDRCPFPEMASHFDEVLQAANAWEVLACLDRIGPQVTHLIAPAGDFMTFRQIVVHSPCPVVFDPFDCARGMMKKEYQPSPSMLRAERDCFARADHVCARSLEPLYLKNHFGYRMPGITYFPEYCWVSPRQRIPRRLDPGEELHVVYAGGVRPEDRYSPDRQGYSQYLEIGRLLAQQKIHLHLYPTPSQDSVQGFTDLYSMYLAEEKRNRFFHIHQPVPFSALLKQFSRYDAALHVFGPGVSDRLGKNTRAKLHHSGASKLFDYIQAGLPVLIHEGRHQRRVLRTYGEAVPISHVREAREKLERVLKRPPPARPVAASLDIHAPRLANMYRKVWTSRGERSCRN